jgi:ABC-type antimicrobial peptide transport system permease subunit
MLVTTDVAESVVGDNGWWTVDAPAGEQSRRDLAQVLGVATGLPSTPDPAVAPDPAGAGLIYDTVGGSGPLTFEQKFSALFSGEVTSSTLGLISIVGLGLGFVIAVSSFLAAVQERKREFGIMSSIGLADEVLYFFLVESFLVFIAAYLVGVIGAGAAVALVIPGIATVTAWGQASAMVAAFLPAMAIVGALVPVHRLLQQRPVALLEAR